MKPDPQELARRFNEDEAVWQAYEEKRKLRRLFGPHWLPAQEALDKLDWPEAEQECREVRAVGFFFPEQP